MHSDGVRGVIIPNKKEPNLLKFRFFFIWKNFPHKIHGGGQYVESFITL